MRSIFGYILSLVIGITGTIYWVNDSFARINANNLATTYYRACTISTAHTVNKYKLSNEIREDGYKACWYSSIEYYKILVKNL